MHTGLKEAVQWFSGSMVQWFNGLIKSMLNHLFIKFGTKQTLVEEQTY